MLAALAVLIPVPVLAVLGLIVVSIFTRSITSVILAPIRVAFAVTTMLVATGRSCASQSEKQCECGDCQCHTRASCKVHVQRYLSVEDLKRFSSKPYYYTDSI